jgi:hypothetical protein
VDKVSKTTKRLQSPWGSLTYYFSFLLAELTKNDRLGHLFAQTVLSFFEMKNKRSAFPDVGIWDKDIFIFYFL